MQELTKTMNLHTDYDKTVLLKLAPPGNSLAATAHTR